MRSEIIEAQAEARFNWVCGAGAWSKLTDHQKRDELERQEKAFDAALDKLMEPDARYIHLTAKAIFGNDEQWDKMWDSGCGEKLMMEYYPQAQRAIAVASTLRNKEPDNAG